MTPVRTFAGLLLFVCIVSKFVTIGNALTCLECDRSQCKFPVGCKFGFTWDVCGCCFRCAKGLGEKCGGPWTEEGRCAKGLGCSATVFSQKIGKCVPQKDAPEKLDEFNPEINNAK